MDNRKPGPRNNSRTFAAVFGDAGRGFEDGASRNYLFVPIAFDTSPKTLDGSAFTGALGVTLLGGVVHAYAITRPAFDLIQASTSSMS